MTLIRKLSFLSGSRASVCDIFWFPPLLTGKNFGRPSLTLKKFCSPLAHWKKNWSPLGPPQKNSHKQMPPLRVKNDSSIKNMFHFYNSWFGNIRTSHYCKLLNYWATETHPFAHQREEWPVWRFATIFLNLLVLKKQIFNKGFLYRAILYHFPFK